MAISTVFFYLGLTNCRLGTTPYDTDCMEHIFVTPSSPVYTISCMASNPVGNTTMEYNVSVQDPVIAGCFSVTSNGPVEYGRGQI